MCRWKLVNQLASLGDLLCPVASPNSYGGVTRDSLFCHLTPLNNPCIPSKVADKAAILVTVGRTNMEGPSIVDEGVTAPSTQLTHEQQQQLVMQYAPLVRRVARSLPLEIPGLLEYEDAVGYGTCGLVEAVRRYDPSKGTNFHAYAVRRIRGSIIDAFRRMDRLSRAMRQKARDVQRAQSELEVALGRTPTDEEAAAFLGITRAQYHDAQASTRWVTVSLDKLLDKDESGDSFPAAEMPTSMEGLDFTTIFEEKELYEGLSKAVQGLPEREKLVVALYYVEKLTMKEIATVLSVSETRISQLHSQAVKRLRRVMLAYAA